MTGTLYNLKSGQITVADASTTTADATDLNQIDGITAGTVTASKALVVDSNADLSGLRNVTFTGALNTGTSATPVNNSTANGSALQLWVNPTATTGRFNALRVESLAAPATAQPVGCYAIRGVTGVKTGLTVGGATASYFAGVQGKLDFAGTLGNGGAGSIYAAAVLAQIGTSGTYGAETQLYGLWVDNQGATGTEALRYLVNITNNGGVVDSVFKVYGNNACVLFADLETIGGGMGVVGAGTYSTADGYLNIKVNGSAYRIPFFAGTD